MPEPISSLIRFLRRAISDLPGSIGSTYLGLWFPAVPACLFFVYQYHKIGWQHMKTDLMIGCVITVISYMLLFLYCIVRNVYREHVALVAKEKSTREQLEWIQKIPMWQGYESEAAWKAAIDEQNRLVTLGHFADGVFSQIQVDAFRLAKDIRTFLAEFPVPKKTDYAAYDAKREVFASTNDVHIWADAKRTVDDKLRARYVLTLQARTTAIYHRFVEAGLTDRHLGVLADTARKEEDFLDMMATLRADALKLEDL